jgi:hypothetical protein
MKRLLALFALATSIAPPLAAQGERQVKVLMEFRQTGTRTQDTLRGSGSVVVIERGGVRSRGGLAGNSTETHTRRSSGVFTLVRDGGDALMSVATRVPYREVAVYHDYATGLGYVTSGVAFENVGTRLRVHADILPEDRIRLRLTPSISYFSADGSGAIDFTEASTELDVRSGAPVSLGGGTQRVNELTRQILGVRSGASEEETSIVLTATIQ